jgi:hypothetical protein
MTTASPYSSYVDQAANAFGIPTQIFQSLVQTESSYNPNAVSTKGAIGLTQLEPSTAAGLGVDPYDPLQNIAGGAKYLSQQFTKFGNWGDALAAYNAGPGNIAAGQGYAAKVLSGAQALGYAPATGAGAAAAPSSPAGTAAAPGWFSLQNFLGLGSIDFTHIALYGVAIGGLVVVGYFGIRALFGAVGVELPKASDAAKLAAL